MHQSAKPSIVILATGGTIAGQAGDSSAPSHYTSGVMDVSALLQSVPQLADHAVISGEQIANIGSEDMSEQVWLRLANRLQQLANDENVAGAVVLHGTDTMEETAYFLNLTVKSAKPIIMTGAMRPANALSADGPANILDAVRLAAWPGAAGLGVLVVLNEKIHAARDMVKTDTLNLDAFSSPGVGPLGVMIEGKPAIRRTPTRDHTITSEFSIAESEKLPRVEILYGHAGMTPTATEAVLATDPAGVVFAGVGAGNIHNAVKPALQAAAERGIVIACSSRVPGPVIEQPAQSPEKRFVYADNLHPQ
ncbi:MAG: asparaginase, partial [Planctomycetes bacterium]|nr:asparaginase [Planctomycetota bacterium]